MNMLGVAYEVAAILGAEVKLPEASYEKAAEKAADAVSVKVEDTQANPHYAAKIIKNVKIGPVTAMDADEADECRHPPA